MKYISIYAFLFIRHITSTAVINDEEHSFLRRLQAIQFPQCGNPLCWCDVNAATSTSSVCPEYPSDSIYTSKEDIATFFASLELKNPTNQDLQLCYPDLSTSVNLQGDSIDPNILCEEGILLGGKSTKDSNAPRHCLKGCKKHPDTAVCGIKFMHDEALCQITPDNYDTNCSSDKVADSYMVKTFRNDKKRQKRGYFSFHEGGKCLFSFCKQIYMILPSYIGYIKCIIIACGVCSTAQDVASFMRYSFPDTNNQVTIDILSFLCYKTITLNPTPLYPKALVDQISICLQNGITGIVPSADLSPVNKKIYFT